MLVGKVYFGFIDEELVEIDKFVCNNIINWFGLVCEVVYGVDKGLVFEVVFEGFNCFICYKFGVVMWFLRILWLCWDKLVVEVDWIEIFNVFLFEN